MSNPDWKMSAPDGLDILDYQPLSRFNLSTASKKPVGR